MAHSHEFASIWTHLGRYGRQDVHLHHCFTASCFHVVVGAGTSCDGDRKTHVQLRLGDAWAHRESEGKPLVEKNL